MGTTNIIDIIKRLDVREQQLLKDTINEGSWGDSSETFLNDRGEQEEYDMFAYCTNDSKLAGHFHGKEISSMFRSIYSKLCNSEGIGKYISHCSDWWGDGSGDMLFIRDDVFRDFENWAKL